VNKLKHSRAASFAVIGIIYILATAVGVLTFCALRLDWWLALLIADVAATVFTFACSVILGNASVYDPYWSVQPPVILLAFALGREWTVLGVLLLVAVFFWAVRLTANWAYTFKDLTHQDWRYTMLHDKTGVFYPVINFIGIHMVPTFVVWGCILPAVYAVREGLAANPASIAFVLLSVFAAGVQGIADIQMHTFQRHRDGTFIRRGLWKYSRHPNYLGEILMWWGVGLSVVCAAPHAWYLLGGALANTVLFLAVSIPLAEGRQSRKPGYAEYKKQTRMLLPIKKKG
jgi:steroid 5-alpha reductase family enzyme